MTRREARRLVARAARYLDKYGPERWWTKIRRRRLNMNDSCNCIAGQLYGNFYYGMENLRLDSARSRDVDDAFYPIRAPDDTPIAEDLWWAEIRKRREAS